MRVSTETQDILSGIIPKVIPILNEKQKRLFLGIVADELGHGGVAFVNEVSGASRQTISTGAAESKDTAVRETVDVNQTETAGRIRKPGAGRKPLTDKYPDLHEKIQNL